MSLKALRRNIISKILWLLMVFSLLLPAVPAYAGGDYDAVFVKYSKSISLPKTKTVYVIDVTSLTGQKGKVTDVIYDKDGYVETSPSTAQNVYSYKYKKKVIIDAYTVKKGTVKLTFTVRKGGKKTVYKATITIGKKKNTSKKKAAKTYTVKYDLNGGKGSISNQKKTNGKNLKLSTKKPTKEGYLFKGWSVKKNGAVKYKAGATYKAESSVTLYAKWAKKEGNVYGVAIATATSDMKEATKNSAKLFEKAIESRYPKGYKCKKNNVNVITDEGKYLLTKSQIRKIIENTYNKSSTNNDIYYIGYFGHGKEEAGNGVGFFVKSTEIDKDDYYPYKEFISMVMEMIPKGDVVIFIDACNSGCYASEDAISDLSDRDQGRLHIITSANAYEGSNNKLFDNPLQFIMLFGKAYMLGMYNMGSGLDIVVEADDLEMNVSDVVSKGLSADSNKDKKVTMKEIHSYMEKMADGLEHPQYYSKESNFAIFAKH